MQINAPVRTWLLRHHKENVLIRYLRNSISGGVIKLAGTSRPFSVCYNAPGQIYKHSKDLGTLQVYVSPEFVHRNVSSEHCSMQRLGYVAGICKNFHRYIFERNNSNL